MSSKYSSSNTSSFYALAWISFVVSSIGMVIGLIYLPLDFYPKAFLGMTYLFSISACFVLAKVVRDKQEQEDYVKKIELAKTEQMISKYISTDEA